MTKFQWIVDTLDQTWATISSTVELANEDDFELATPCPGWSVRDVVSHLAGFQQMMLGEAVSTREGPWPNYVKNLLGEFNEAYVDAYRARSGREIVTLFRDVTGRSLDSLRALDEEQWEKVGWSPEGDRPFHRFQETRILDSWIHLNDIRDALGLVGADHGPGEEVVLRRFVSTLPYVVAKRTGAVEGTVVVVTLTGAGARRATVALAGGRAEFVDDYAGPANVDVTTSLELFWRRAAGRVNARAVLSDPATAVHGDTALGERLIEGLATMI